ncbi:hypothetical protein SASPL_123688 [Salvia splendens]|uniref:Uncharacterized protein n=1 Tax=Salvia splendens TaxID=180675 RepID=A0A8X8ZT85_SALSN|nr:hypothetical protein SASPL_123688 [Salvia splendens]
MEDDDVNINVNQSRAKKRKIGIKKEPRSVHCKDYEKVKVMDGNPPIEVVKGKCKRCEKKEQEEGSNKGQTVLNYVGDAKLFLERKLDLTRFFKKEGMSRVSITSDCWTDVKSYLNKFNTNVLDVKEAVKWITCSAQRSSQWTKMVNILAKRIDSKKALCLDVPTHWNSTYLMLQFAIPYEEAFQLYIQMYPSYRKDLSQKKHKDEFIGLLEKHDWICVRKMIEYFQKFYELPLLILVRMIIKGDPFSEERVVSWS